MNIRMRLPLVFSVAAHVAIILALMAVSPISTFRLDNNISNNNQSVVHAAVIDSQQVAEAVQAIQDRANQQQIAEQQKVQQLQAQAEAARQFKIAEEQRLAQIKASQQQAMEQQKKTMEQLQIQQKHLAQLQAQKQQQLAEEKALALKKQREQAEKVKALAAQQKKLAAAHAKKQQELALKQKALQQQLMQQQISNEQAQLLRAQQTQGIIDQYRARILIAIANQWLIPDGVNPQIYCVFTLDLTPSGVVTHAQLIRSSGNSALDRSAETAIYKSSPLPVPADPQALNQFRHFTLKMTPQDVRH
ncbi:MAG: cell envelope integrity protein TolA [Proteobacteria bacterium]|nr:cell envelope integrity protein TolA [Pseudomonadota bacterium]